MRIYEEDRYLVECPNDIKKLIRTVLKMQKISSENKDDDLKEFADVGLKQLSNFLREEVEELKDKMFMLEIMPNEDVVAVVFDIEVSDKFYEVKIDIEMNKFYIEV